MAQRVATLLQIAGIGVGTVAAWLVAPALGLAVLAVGLLAFGLAVERSG